ncbi:MAG: PIN domain nuclease [Chloroflexi bacterium]|nr:PIN domain nuclease [Chloroflexota bacterium]
MVVRVVGALLGGLAGWWLGSLIAQVAGLSQLWIGGGAGVLIGVLLGAWVSPFVGWYPLRTAVQRFVAVPTATLLLAAFGLIGGLVVATLLSVPLSRLPGVAGLVVPIVLITLLGVLGAAVLVSREKDLFEGFPGLRKLGRVESPPQEGLLLDTSAIIDGRVADLVETGFVHGTLVVPRFILDELRHIADSSDALRRNRGRRGLEILNRLRKESKTSVQVLDVDGRDGAEADVRLVKLAKQLGCPIMTTDFNLNRVAEFQGVTVLNINELANALKPVVLPGEEMTVRVIQEGKEPGQGVGFLDDGTMVVIEGGKRFINTHLEVVVTRVLQTAAGRLIFAQPKGAG